MYNYDDLCADRDDAADYGDNGLVATIEQIIPAVAEPWEDDPGCPDCGYREDCSACRAARADYDALIGETVDAAIAGEVPF